MIGHDAKGGRDDDDDDVGGEIVINISLSLSRLSLLAIEMRITMRNN